jgi:hypothetical protein
MGDMRRFLPLVLIGLLVVVFLPQLLNRGRGSKTLSTKDRATLTRDAVDRIDRGETRYRAAHGTYTDHLANLVAADKRLAAELTIPLTVELDVGADAKSYLVQVSSDVLSFARSRANGKLVAASCRALKSSSDVKCPEPAKPAISTQTTPTTG